MIKAVIFDFDGTLVDSEPNYGQSDVETICHFGGELTIEEHHKYVGIGPKRFINEMKEKFGIENSFEEIQTYQKAAYLKRAMENTRVFPEMRRLVEELFCLGIPMAVASGTQKDMLETLLNKTELRRYFDVVISSEQVERGKPAPDVFLKAAELLKTPPQECLVLEDSPPGALAAEAAGMELVTIPGEELLPYMERYPSYGIYLEKGMDQFTAETVLDLLPLCKK